MQQPDQVLSDLKSKKYAPIYFLQGDEPFFIDEIAHYIEEHAIDESAKSFNQIILYGKDVRITDILNQARRFPMMSERQTVIVKEAQNIADINQADGIKMLEAYLDNPQPSTVLVFCYKYKTLDGRKSLSKNMAKKAVMVNSKKFYDNQLPSWVKGYVKSKGCSITDKAVVMLCENIGNNLERLSNEIQKVLVNYKEGEKIEIDDHLIDKYVGISKDYNVFELQRALMFKDALKANKIINYFEANPRDNPIIPIIALIFSFYTKLLQIHASTDKSPQVLARVLGVSPYFVQEYQTAAKNYPMGIITRNIHFIRDADLQSKGVGASMPPGQILRELVYKLLH